MKIKIKWETRLNSIYTYSSYLFVDGIKKGTKSGKTLKTCPGTVLVQKLFRADLVPGIVFLMVLKLVRGNKSA